MKRFVLILAAMLLAFNGFAQKAPKFTEEDAKQFYRTMEGDYKVINQDDSLVATVHFTPIWQTSDNRFQWMYLEVLRDKDVVLQKVLEIKPKTDKVFQVIAHDLKDPKQFEGKWGNRNYFDGFNTSILKGSSNMTFVKTSDFSYQMNGFKRLKALECFPKGDSLHIKFVQEEERFYIKRVPKRTNRIFGYKGLKELTDGPVG